MVFNISNKPKKIFSTAQKEIYVRTHCMFYTTQQHHSTESFMALKNLPLAKQIKLQEGIHGYKVNNSHYLLSNFSLMDMLIAITN